MNVISRLCPNKAVIVPVVFLAAMQWARGEERHVNIVDDIMADSSIIIIQPEDLNERLDWTEPEEEVHRPSSGRMAGYRVQVFSDGNQRTARNEARRKAMMIGSKFPQYRIYTSFSSPYWRLRVGDFRTQKEAQAVAAEIKGAFPAFAKEIRVVRDRVLISN